MGGAAAGALQARRRREVLPGGGEALAVSALRVSYLRAAQRGALRAGLQAQKSRDFAAINLRVDIGNWELRVTVVLLERAVRAVP